MSCAYSVILKDPHKLSSTLNDQLASSLCDLGRFNYDVKTDRDKCSDYPLILIKVLKLCPLGTVKLRLLFYRSKDDGEHSLCIDEDVMGCSHSHDVFYLYLRTCRYASVCGCIEK